MLNSLHTKRINRRYSKAVRSKYYLAPFVAFDGYTTSSSCKRISKMSVLRFSSLSRITSWRSDSSFADRVEFNLRKPSSHSFFDLQKFMNKEIRNQQLSAEQDRAPLWPHQGSKILPWAGMDSSKENSPGCGWIACYVHFICNVASPQHNWVMKLIICQCPFKQSTNPMLWYPFAYLKWQGKKPDDNRWFPVNNCSQMNSRYPPKLMQLIILQTRKSQSWCMQYIIMESHEIKY